MLDQALALEKRALALHTELGDKGKAAGAQINIGQILIRGGRPDEALAAFETGLAAAKAAGAREYAATATGAIGVVWYLRKDYEKAAKWVADAKKAKEALADERGAAGEALNLGNIRREQKRFDEARAAIEGALATMEKLGWKGDQVKALIALAAVATDQKKPADAVGYLRRAMAIVKPTKVINTIVPVQVRLAQALEAAGDRDAAKANYRECARWVEALGDEEDLQAVKDGYARLGLTWGDTAKAGDAGENVEFERAAERTAKARKHWDAAKSWLAKGDKAHAMGDLREAAESLSKPAYRQSAARKEMDGVFREGVRLGAEVNDASIVYEFLARRRGCATTEAVYSNAASHGPGLGNANLLTRLQAQLADGTACVAYGVFDDETFAVVADRRTARVVKLGPTKAIAAAAAGLAFEDDSTEPFPSTEAIRALAELRELVARPLALGASVRTVVVAAPDEPLASVPAILLFEDCDVSHLVSPEALWAAGPARTRGASAIVLGSDAEAKAWGGRRIDPATATWDTVLEALPEDGSCRLVVLTAKVRPDPDDANYRAFEFPAVPGKHVVDGAKVGDAPFPAHLVVLTGGDAGRIAIEPGEGPWGLPETFLGAGARGVVASRWRTDAAATRAFVDKLASVHASGATMAAAVRAAQAAVRSQPQWRHPRFWAGWVLVGLPE
jgi:tetratricopeptide (TPR) repeat protein